MEKQRRKYGKRLRKRVQAIMVLEESDMNLIRELARREGISISEKLKRTLEPWLEQLRHNPELRRGLMRPLIPTPLPTPMPTRSGRR